MVLRKGWVGVLGFDLRIRGGLMANVSARGCGPCGILSLTNASEGRQLRRGRNARTRLVFLGVMVFLAPLIFAQSTPQVTGVEPQSGKVNASVTVSGENLGKTNVSGVFLSE